MIAGETKKIKFKIMHLEGFAIIDGPCTVFVKNNSILKHDQLYTDDGHNRWILNLKAIERDKLETLKIITNEPEYNLSYFKASKLFFTGALWEDQVINDADLPVKGEDVIAVFGHVDGVLRCTNITIIPRKTPEIFMPGNDLTGKLKEFEDLIKELENE